MSLKGTKQSKEHVQKRIAAFKAWYKLKYPNGKTSWNKGIPMRPESKLKMAAYHIGKPLSVEHKKKISATNKIVFNREELRRRKSLLQKGERGSNWRGGLTETNHIIRNSVEYKLWRESVYKRDDYTCCDCGEKGGKLNADHIKPFSTNPESRFDINNGRTLCKKCHMKTDTWGRKGKIFENGQWKLRTA